MAGFSFPRPSIRRKSPLALEPLEARALLSCNTISGFVFHDFNANGLFDPGETPIANSPIELRDAAGRVAATTQTNANGRYEFSNDPSISTAPAEIRRTVDFGPSKTDFTQTKSVAQFDASKGQLTSVEIIHDTALTSQIEVENRDQAPATITATISGTMKLTIPGLSPLTTNNLASETFTAGAFDNVIDFGGASGHDFGAQTANGSKKVTLTSAADLARFAGSGTVSLTETAQATSSAAGAGNLLTQVSSTASAHVTVVYHYLPSNCLKPGNYTIIQKQQPAGYLDGKESKNGTVLAGSVGTDKITVMLGNTDLVNNNFGEVRPAKISGYVYLDNNNNGLKQAGEKGIQAASVTLTGTDDTGQTVNETKKTGSDGSYNFGNLRPGQYTISEAQPPGYLDGKDVLGNIKATLANDQIKNMALRSGEDSRNNNFGELLPASIAGCVYLDDNDNGIKESLELPIPGVTVILNGTDDLGRAVNLAVFTDLNGKYSFTGLRPGSYSVRELQPFGFADGKDTTGNVGGTKFNDQFFVALSMGQDGKGYNFGERLQPPPQIVIPPPPPITKQFLLSSSYKQWLALLGLQ